MCRSCFSRTSLCSGVSLPYSPASPSRSFPAFFPPSLKLQRTCRYYEDAKTSRVPLQPSSFVSTTGSRLRLLVRSSEPAIAFLTPGCCSAGVIRSGVQFSDLTRDIPCFLCASCRFAMFQDPGRAFPSGHIRRIGAVLVYLYDKNPCNTVISGFTRMAPVLAVYASCRHH